MDRPTGDSHSLALAFAAVYDQIDTLKQSSPPEKASAFVELERTVRGLNSVLAEEVRMAVKDGMVEMRDLIKEEVKLSVRETMEQPHSQTQQVSSHARAGPSSFVTQTIPYPPPPPQDPISTLHANMFDLPPASASHTGSAYGVGVDVMSPTSALLTNFSMSRDVKTVPDLWKEYTVGWSGLPPVRDVYEGAGLPFASSGADAGDRKRRRGKRFRDDSERKFYRRRKKVLEMVEMMIARGAEESDAVDRVETLRERRKVTLNKLGEIIPEMTAEEMSLV